MPTIVDCPCCGKKVEWTEINTFRPFCSQRCKLADLGAWANEQYKISSNEPPETPDLPPSSA